MRTSSTLISATFLPLLFILPCPVSLCAHENTVTMMWWGTRGLPEVISVDNGPEFSGKVMDNWAWKNKVQLDFSRPGKPVDNAFIESFNRTVRLECLNDNWFLSMQHARKLVEEWRNDYNNVRPHSALNGQTPAEYTTQNTESSLKLVLQ